MDTHAVLTVGDTILNIPLPALEVLLSAWNYVIDSGDAYAVLDRHQEADIQVAQQVSGEVYLAIDSLRKASAAASR